MESCKGYLEDGWAWAWEVFGGGGREGGECFEIVFDWIGDWRLKIGDWRFEV